MNQFKPINHYSCECKKGVVTLELLETSRSKTYRVKKCGECGWQYGIKSITGLTKVEAPINN